MRKTGKGRLTAATRQWGGGAPGKEDREPERPSGPNELLATALSLLNTLENVIGDGSQWQVWHDPGWGGWRGLSSVGLHG